MLINYELIGLGLIIGYFYAADIKYSLLFLILFPYYKKVILWVYTSLYLLSLYIWFWFDSLLGGFQFLWYDSCNYHIWNVVNAFAVDGLSIYFVILTTFIFIVCGLASCKIFNRFFLLSGVLISMEILLLLTFTVLDLLLFSCFFESLIVFIIVLMLVWGSRARRIKALTYFVIYTIFGSIFLFIALFIIFYEKQSFFFSHILNQEMLLSRHYAIWWGCLFVVFAIKLPVIPFHLWLPEAHVEAPTIGSVILASLLLKIGGYGILRFLIQTSEAHDYYKTVVILLALYSIILSSVAALRQSDLKKIIAYSSIAHINIGILGIFVYHSFGYVANLLLILSHGFISAGLFLLIGVLYEKARTRIVYYYRGLASVIPLWSIYLVIFILSNVGFPGTGGFVVEFLVMLGLGNRGAISLLIILIFGLFCCFAYCIYFITLLVFGTVGGHISTFQDISRLDNLIFLILLISNIVIGISPSLVLGPIYWQTLYWPTLWIFTTFTAL